MKTFPLKLNLNLSQKALILVALPLAFEILFVSTLAALLLQSRQIEFHQSNAKAAIAAAEDISKLSYDIGTNLMAYNVTKSAFYRERYSWSKQEISNKLHVLTLLTLNDPALSLQVWKMQALSTQAGTLLDSIRASTESGATPLASLASDNRRSTLMSISSALTRELNDFTHRLQEAENIDPVAQYRSDALIFWCLAGGVLLNILLAFALAMYFNKGTSRRLDLLVDNTKRLSRGDSLNPRMEGSDEIASLDKVFHDMARALDSAMRKERAIVENASDGICTIDATGHFQAVNQAALRMWKCKQSEILHKRWSEVLIEETACLGKALSAAIKTGKEVLDRLIAMVNNLLDLEKLDSGKMDLDLAAIDIGYVLERSAASVRAMAEQQGVRLVVADNDCEAVLDADRIVQVIVNLLSNAIKFSPTGGTIKLSATELKEQIRVEVKDQGRGIPEDKSQAIFDRFSQVDKADGKLNKGTGLGLAVCKSLSSSHQAGWPHMLLWH